jgi:hypothetical protein
MSHGGRSADMMAEGGPDLVFWPKTAGLQQKCNKAKSSVVVKSKSLSILTAFSGKWHTSNTSELKYEMSHSVCYHHSSAIIIVKTSVIFLSFIEAVGLLLHLSSSSDCSPLN